MTVQLWIYSVYRLCSPCRWNGYVMPFLALPWHLPHVPFNGQCIEQKFKLRLLQSNSVLLNIIINYVNYKYIHCVK